MNLLKQKKSLGNGLINPHFTKEDYIAEASRCINELGLLQLKLQQ